MNDQTPWQRMARMASLGTEFLLIFGLFLVAGFFSDASLRTTPVFTILGTLLGFGLGLWRLVRDARRLGKEIQDDRKPSGPGGSHDDGPNE